MPEMRVHLVGRQCLVGVINAIPCCTEDYLSRRNSLGSALKRLLRFLPAL